MFVYKNGVLTCEGVALAEVAAAVGTPAYVYSRAELLGRARAYAQAAGDALVSYAVKANGNPVLLGLLREAGLGADVTSGGELFLALEAGIAPERIIYSGVGKRPDEIEMALRAGICALHVESEMELDVIARLAELVGKPARVSVRVNPDISADTHPYDSTGKLGHKFGVPRATAVALLNRAAVDPWLQPAGIAAHIGSQITRLEPYAELAKFMVALAYELAGEGIDLAYIDMGGGLGINYQNDDAPAIADWITAVGEPVRKAGYALVVEPGRSIIAPSGFLLTKVLYTKAQGGKNFVIVDAGQNDLIRPAMYGAFHPALAVREPVHTTEVVVDVVGPICETGDFLARERALPPLEQGDLLVFTQAGAYGFAMSSNYNGRLRLPEVLIDGADFRVIRRRQSYAHLLDGCD
jgi:diaminopimelate decarboxylase